MKPPPGFERLEHQGAVIVAQQRFAHPLLAAGVSDPVGLVQAAPTEHQGRGRLARVDLEDGGTALVRPLLRGGLLGKLVRRLSLDPWRSVSELAVSAEASARGASVLDVLAAVTRPAGLGYHHGIVTREVEDARDLLGVLRDEGPGPARWAALRAAARAVRALHEAGVDHVDLNLKNVLLTPEGRAIVIDLDRCRIGERIRWRHRKRNLLRLLRSWTKLRAAHPDSVHCRDPLVFARAYADSNRRLRRRLVRHGRATSFWLHRLQWSLFPPRLA